MPGQPTEVAIAARLGRMKSHTVAPGRVNGAIGANVTRVPEREAQLNITE